MQRPMECNLGRGENTLCRDRRCAIWLDVHMEFREGMCWRPSSLETRTSFVSSGNPNATSSATEDLEGMSKGFWRRRRYMYGPGGSRVLSGKPLRREMVDVDVDFCRCRCRCRFLIWVQTSSMIALEQARETTANDDRPSWRWAARINSGIFKRAKKAEISR